MKGANRDLYKIRRRMRCHGGVAFSANWSLNDKNKTVANTTNQVNI